MRYNTLLFTFLYTFLNKFIIDVYKSGDFTRGVEFLEEVHELLF
jgi:hypothetical protein